MILRKQPGCWLRSSHSFKECVIAHWSSEVARKITGAKLYTEIADCSVFNNMHLDEIYQKRVLLGKRAKKAEAYDGTLSIFAVKFNNVRRSFS